jgi:perosamine synthetase
LQVRLFKPRVREEAIAAVADVMRSGWIGMGPRTQDFEKAFGEFVQVRYAVAVNTCTSALHLAVKLLQLESRPGKTEVITTPVTFVSTNTVLLYEGLTPVFADVDPKTGNVTPASVAARITPRTGAIMLTHFGGYACDLDGFAELGRRHDLPIIEDCAHACGAWYKERRVGASGNLCAFSFDAIKNLTTGDGGMLIAGSDANERRARSLRYMGLSKDAFKRVSELKEKAYSWEYEVPEVGYRYHMNDIQAAMGLVHLKYLDEDNAHRERIARKYRQLLAGIPGVALLERAPDRKSGHHLFCILAENRNALADKMTRSGVIVGVHYNRNDVYPIFPSSELPHAQQFCSCVMSLPLHLDLTDEEIEYVANVIRGGW